MKVNWLGGTTPRIDHHARRRGPAISAIDVAVDPNSFQIPATLEKTMRWLYQVKEWGLSFDMTWAYATRLVWHNNTAPPTGSTPNTTLFNSALNYSGHATLDDLRSNVRFKPQSGPNIDMEADKPYKILDERVQGSGFSQTMFGNLGTTFPKEQTTAAPGVLAFGDTDYSKFTADIAISGGGAGTLTSYSLHPYLGIWEAVFTSVSLNSATCVHPILFLTGTGVNNKRVKLPSDVWGKEFYAVSPVPVELHPNVFVWLAIGYDIVWSWHVDWDQSGAWPYDPSGNRSYDTNSAGIAIGALPTGIAPVGCVNPPSGFSLAAQTQKAGTGLIDVPGDEDIDDVSFQMKYQNVQGQTGGVNNTLTISNWDLSLTPTDFFDYS